ncbi:MAG: hypothetical protein VX815_08435 [Gemmatimonadota bacterium]|nr:hypothetical protein [Gemmatimonadota bacterium]
MIIHPAISVAWRRSGFALVVPLALVLAMPSPGEAQASVLHPTELCRDHADASIVTFEDALRRHEYESPSGSMSRTISPATWSRT